MILSEADLMTILNRITEVRAIDVVPGEFAFMPTGQVCKVAKRPRLSTDGNVLIECEHYTYVMMPASEMVSVFTRPGSHMTSTNGEVYYVLD